MRSSGDGGYCSWRGVRPPGVNPPKGFIVGVHVWKEFVLLRVGTVEDNDCRSKQRGVCCVLTCESLLVKTGCIQGQSSIRQVH